MKTRKMDLFAACFVSLVIVATIGGPASAFSYVSSYSTWDSVPDDYYYQDSTVWEEENATASAGSSTNSCTTETFARGSNGGAASAGISAFAGTDKVWEWDGPAGTAPGGSLYWYYAGDGYSQASGVNDDGDGGYVSSNGVAAGAVAYGSTQKNGGARAYGSVTDYATGSGDAYVMGNCSYDNGVSEDVGSGTFDFSISWNAYGSSTATIPSGTGSFELNTEVYCSCSSTGDNDTTGISESETSAHTYLLANTTFTSN